MSHRIVVAFVLASTLLAGTATAEQASSAFERSSLDGIRLDLHAANLLMSHTSSDAVGVAITEIEVADSCRVRVEPEGRTLVVEARRTAGHGKCRVDVRMSVPAGLPIHADVGAGDVTLGELRTPLDLNLGAGTVEGKVEDNEIHVSNGAGDIDLHGLTAAVHASTGAGDVSLRFGRAPVGTIEASSGVGDVEVHLPTDTAADTSASTGLGTVEQELTHRPGAATVVRARTGLGNVQVDDA